MQKRKKKKKKNKEKKGTTDIQKAFLNCSPEAYFIMTIVTNINAIFLSYVKC